ncbi:hypothetical protein D3C75_1174100 [compost metagenome]
MAGCIIRSMRSACSFFSGVSVGTAPIMRLQAAGEMQLERTPKEAMSRAMAFDMPTIPSLAAA